MKQLILAVLSIFFFATNADAWVLCAKKDKRTDSYREGTTVKLRNLCRKSEVVVDPAEIGLQGPEGPAGPEGSPGEKGDSGDTGPKGDPGVGLEGCVVRESFRTCVDGWNWDAVCESGEVALSVGFDRAEEEIRSVPYGDLHGWNVTVNTCPARAYLVCCPGPDG